MRLFLLFTALAAILLLLKWQFPYAASNSDDMARILYLVMIIALLAAGGGAMRRVSLPHAARNAAIWLAVIVVLVMLYSFRNGMLYNRLMGELVPHRMQVTDQGELLFHSDESGHFHIEAEVNGAPVKFLVDTGASDVVLSPSDAARAGLETDTLNFSRRYETANGMVTGAPVRLRELRIGTIVRTDQPASVNGADMDESLLGMRFLNSLSGYAVNGNELTLRP